MLNSHFRFKLLVWLSLFTLPILACGMQTVAAPDTQIRHEMSTDVNPSLSAAPVPTGGERMEVTAFESVYVRPSAGTGEYPIGELEHGQIVEVVDVEVIGDSLWCHHHEGWTNCKFLKGLE